MIGMYRSNVVNTVPNFPHFMNTFFSYFCTPCRVSSVGVATCYGLDDPGIEFWCGRDFPHSYRPVLGPTQPPITMDTRSFVGVKRPGRGAAPTPLFSAEVLNWVELYLYPATKGLSSLYALASDLCFYFLITLVPV